jgi:hypothetical protein
MARRNLGDTLLGIVTAAGARAGYLPADPGLHTAVEAAAIDADGGALAADTGCGPEVVEPTHRIVDLPPGALAAVLAPQSQQEQQ